MTKIQIYPRNYEFAPLPQYYSVPWSWDLSQLLLLIPGILAPTPNPIKFLRLSSICYAGLLNFKPMVLEHNCERQEITYYLKLFSHLIQAVLPSICLELHCFSFIHIFLKLDLIMPTCPTTLVKMKLFINFSLLSHLPKFYPSQGPTQGLSPLWGLFYPAERAYSPTKLWSPEETSTFPSLVIVSVPGMTLSS